MKKLDLSFDGINDKTGYLHTLNKCLSAAIAHSPWQEWKDDIIAVSGFAFRLWVNKDLCPSAMSIWQFDQQKAWVENSGLKCAYTERLWHEGEWEEQRRKAALEQIKASIDSGLAAVAWDLGDAEWGLIIGYDESNRILYTKKTRGEEGSLPYEKLGQLEIPILSVLTLTGYEKRPMEEIVKETFRLAAEHLRGNEWCENASGLAAFPVLLEFIKNTEGPLPWQLEYTLGNIAGLRYFAWRFMEKHASAPLAELYRLSYEAWMKAFTLKRTKDCSEQIVKNEITACLEAACSYEQQVLPLLD